jgi:hypothetical protein
LDDSIEDNMMDCSILSPLSSQSDQSIQSLSSPIDDSILLEEVPSSNLNSSNIFYTSGIENTNQIVSGPMTSSPIDLPANLGIGQFSLESTQGSDFLKNSIPGPTSQNSGKNSGHLFIRSIPAYRDNVISRISHTGKPLSVFREHISSPPLLLEEDLPVSLKPSLALEEELFSFNHEPSANHESFIMNLLNDEDLKQMNSESSFV